MTDAIHLGTSIKWNTVQHFKKKKKVVYSDMERCERYRLDEKSVLQNSAYGSVL